LGTFSFRRKTASFAVGRPEKKLFLLPEILSAKGAKDLALLKAFLAKK